MKFIAFSIPILFALTGMACQNDTPQQAAPAEESAQSNEAPQNQDFSMGAPLPETPATGNVQPETAPQGQAGAAQPATAATGKVNPPHGQPGHRCDIAVGAPLDQAPAAKTPATQSQPASPGASPTLNTVKPPTPTPAPATGAATAAGTNPPHGQPGHRCDIAVGAPLPKQ